MGPKEESSRKKVLMKQNSSRKIYIPYYLMIVVVIVIWAFLRFGRGNISSSLEYLVLAFVIFIILFSEIHRLSTYYAVTPDSLIYSSGIFNKTVKKVDFFAISDLDITQHFFHRLLGFGDVNVRLFSKDSTTQVKDINKPEVFAECLEDAISKKRVQAR